MIILVGTELSSTERSRPEKRNTNALKRSRRSKLEDREGIPVVSHVAVSKSAVSLMSDRFRAIDVRTLLSCACIEPV